MATFGATERKGDHMNTRTKLAASGLLIAALAASATPAFASNSNSSTMTGRSGHAARQHVGPLAALVTAGTITQAKADVVETATRTAMNAAQTTNFNAALAALVANGTITQDLATAAKASATSTTGKHGRVNLTTWTVAQRTALHTWLNANPVDRAAIGKAAIAKLVTSGTLTQVQADAVNAALAAAPAKGIDDKGGKRHGKGGHGRDDMAPANASGVTPLA